MSHYQRRRCPARIPYAPTLAVIVHPDADPTGVMAYYLAAATHVVNAGPDGYTVSRAPRLGMTYADVLADAGTVVQFHADMVRVLKVTIPYAGGGTDAA